MIQHQLYIVSGPKLSSLLFCLVWVTHHFVPSAYHKHSGVHIMKILATLSPVTDQRSLIPNAQIGDMIIGSRAPKEPSTAKCPSLTELMSLLKPQPLRSPPPAAIPRQSAATQSRTWPFG
ncbi:hypothetical protein EDD37DRAFT_442681 [Exophiala viscosa]|uniref:uncharacterized protein n=1 Tax=Exophiala viscosa TaxID=2486360 RepID=UPI0021901294|nr:hypothetical protein EDD37DRAFT_442681 [Exophiala viscosa]